MKKLLPILLLAACSAPPTVSLRDHVNEIAKRDGVEGYIAAQMDLQRIRRTDHVVMAHGMKVRNIIGQVGKGGPYVIVGAHHDAVEKSPGADDNASGVAVLLEVARRIQQRPARRPVLFIAFGAEELGTFGSILYTRDPHWPLKDAIGMINMDMVGRLRKKLIVTGVDTAAEWNEVIDATRSDIDMVRKKGGLGPSDHKSFYLNKVPVLHVFTGGHVDYHKETDTADKVNFEGMERVADFIESLVREVADRGALTFAESEVKPKTNGPKPSGQKPALGIIPDYTFEGKGVQLEGVRKGSPAETAGLKAGDVITCFNGKSVASVEEYSPLFFATKPGEKVKLGVLRGDKTSVIEATIGSRP